jgi:hypothetical protein
MKVTGYQLREALRRWTTRLDIASKQFNASLYQFETDRQRSPMEISEDFEKAEVAVAILQETQQAYNGLVKVNVQGHEMTLALAVKRVGTAARLEKMWRSAASDRGVRDRYYSRELTRNKDDVVAVRQVSVEDALQKAEEAARRSSALREAIAVANATELDMNIQKELLD